MDCKPTFTKTRRRAGFSLLEGLVATAVGGILLSGFAALTSYTARNFASMANYVELDSDSRHALDLMSQQVRQTKRLKSFATNELVFEDSDGLDLTFRYVPNEQKLYRMKSRQANLTLLEGCKELTFSIFQRNPIGGTYDQYSTASADTCKLVQLYWVCERDLIKSGANTESVQSSKIVIRKQ